MSACPATGEVLGPYRIVRRIGGGGMGVVFEAYDEPLRRQVALKVIASHLADHPAFRARFTREAQALAALDSAHVVQVYAHGEHDGRLYLATQLVPDGDLGRLLATTGAPPVPVALDLIAQVASGLADAHAAGLIHRDIKPANVLLRRRGSELHAYLSDFGIARQLGAEHTHTRGGTVGTPSYMAPELHTGGTAGEVTDVYSLGCLLWASLVGRAPYAGASDYEIVSAHLEQPVPQLAGEAPQVAAVNRVLRTAMAKDPAARHPSASALRDDLRAALALESSAVPVAVASAGAAVQRSSTPRRAAVPAAGAAVLLVLVAGGVAYAVSRDDVPGPAPDPTPTASTPTASTSPSTSPSTSSPTGDAAAATASLAAALEAQGLMTPAQAECTAERWIEEAGLQEMADAGFFDAEWAYVDQDTSAMTPEIEAAATSAALACATAD